MIIIQLLKDTKYPANYQIIIDSSLGNYAVLRDFFSALSPRHPGQLLSPADRTSSSATAPRPAASAGCPYQQLHHGTPASNKPHPAEKSTPVWLAIWRTWAGFANSQLLSAAFRSIYLYIDGPIPLAATLGCCSNRRKSVGPSVPIAYATSVSPPNEAVAWPGAGVGCKMRLLSGRGSGVGW